jgi:hypothetical protein
MSEADNQKYGLPEPKIETKAAEGSHREKLTILPLSRRDLP